MKISKVKHTRTAVSKKSTKDGKMVAGILYSNPAEQKNAEKHLESHIKKLNEKAQGLYNVFNPISKKKVEDARNFNKQKSNQGSKNEAQKQMEKMLQNFNKITKWLLEKNKKEHASEDEIIQEQLISLEKFTITYIPVGKNYKTGEVRTQQGRQFKIKVTDDFTKENLKQTVKTIVADYLRNSLRVYVTDSKANERIYVPDVIEQLMYSFCLGYKYEKEFNKIPKEQLVLTLQAMNSDYTKKEQIARTVKAINKQNVKVQPDRNGILRLSGAEHVDERKDFKSKKYIFDFVKEYACLEKKKRMEKLLHMRQLIVLYFYGETMYTRPPQGLTALSFGEQLAVDERVFSEDAKKALEIGREESGLNHKAKQAEVKEHLRKELGKRYHKLFVDKVVDLEAADYFWLNWIIDEVEKLFFKGSDGKTSVVRKKHLSLIYLCKRVWNNWTAFLAMKYVDMGKAVYHFAMPDLAMLQNEEAVEYGKLLQEYKEGLTSFDYERIKAEESFERSLTTYVTFAVNTFAQATIAEEFRISVTEGKNQEQKEDVLYNKSFLKESYTDSTRRILQYFGGMSRWADSDVVLADREKLLEMMRQALRFVRDGSTHYTAVRDIDSKMDVALIRKMYDTDVSDLGKLYSEKYCSNNVLWFYSKEDTITFMEKVYKKDGMVKRMPAFKTVIKRSKMNELVRELLGKDYYNSHISNMDADSIRKLEATLYYLLSEIYYHDFIVASDKMQMKLFCDEVFALNTKDYKDGNAARDFQTRVKEIRRNNSQCTLENLCEIIMTDYNMQNTEKERLASKDRGTDKDRTIYKHFPLLLRQCIGQAFLKYVKEQNIYSFLKEPELRNDVAKAEERLREEGKKIQVTTYQNDVFKRDSRLMAWYAVAHFLSPKYLNQLSGMFSSYIQFVNSINNRAETTDNRTIDYESKIAYYQNIIQVLSLVRNYAGRISTEITDYFEGDSEQAEEACAKYLSDYVAFYEEDGRSYAMALKEFAMQKIETGSPSGYVEIYSDGENPKLNRNMILAMLYGNIKSVRENFTKVTLREIKEYYERREKLKSVLESGICKSKKEQQEYKEFQLQKNRIELVDVREFTDIINDLHAKLISWSYLRERDLLYFQLGVHYLRLQYAKDMKDEVLQKEITGENVHITDGGILYQILALNTHSLPLYAKEDGKIVVALKRGAVGTKIGSFIKTHGMKTYMQALELFESVVEHDDIIEVRNYVDHFKYYVYADQSIMDLYGEVYDRFFNYDLKLKKSVTYILEDILKSYFVISEIHLGEERNISNKDVSAKEKYTRKTGYPEMYGNLEADVLTYKLKVGKKEGKKREIEHQVAARTNLFLKQLKEMLEYRAKK